MANSFTPQQIEEFLQEFFDVVGARQYVGARYVPIFGRAGQDTVEWDDHAPYEPLTVVMHDGVSYVSRRYVPAGIEIGDTDYWVQTYRFNAQVEQYRQEVLSFQGQIDQIRADYVPFPDSETYPKYGTVGQVLNTLGDGGTVWGDPVIVTSDVAGPLIDAWLDDHPEATTTVEDGAVTTAKLASGAVTTAKLADGAVTPAKAQARTIFCSPNTNYIEPENLVTLDNMPLNTSGVFRRTHDVEGVTYTMGGVPDDFTYGFGSVFAFTARNVNAGTGALQVVLAYGDADNHLWYRQRWDSTWGAWKSVLVGIEDGAVTTAKLASGAVTTAKLADGAVTAAKAAERDILRAPYGSYVEPDDLVTIDNAPMNTAMVFRRVHVVDDVTYTMEGTPPGITFNFASLITFTARNTATGQGKIQVLSPYSGSYDGTLWWRIMWGSSVWGPWHMLTETTAAGVTLTDHSTNLQPNKPLGNVNGKSVMLTGDSITFGVGSSTALHYEIEEGGVTINIYGNGPNVEGVTPHTEGPLLVESATRRDYESLNGAGWAQQMVSYLANLDCTCRNFGISGMNSRDLVGYLTNWWPTHGPFDYVVVCVGTNDRSASNFATLETNYGSIIDKIRELGAVPVMIANIPTSASNEASHQYHMYQVRDVLRRVCLKKSAMFVDLYTAFLDYCWVTGTTSADALNDSLHPNDTGYRIMYNILTGLLGVGRIPNVTGWM